MSPGVIYHLPVSSYPTLYGTSTTYKMLVYTPPPTVTAGYTSLDVYTPPDSDPTFDSNDELSFLAADTGKQADGPAGNPVGVDATTREEVKATDPLSPSHLGYVYLFHSDTLTGGSAGTTGVNYSFNLTSGNYKATYKMGLGSLAPNNAWGLNPETSTVTTPNYSQALGDRWLNNSLKITVGGASGVNILDRAKYYVTAGCGRTENTFDGTDSGEGAFVVSIGGPVRAIRSYIGANSYKWTVNTDIFYPDREDSVTELRGPRRPAGLRRCRRPGHQPHRHDLLRRGQHRSHHRRRARHLPRHHGNHARRARIELADGVGGRGLARHDPLARHRHQRASSSPRSTSTRRRRARRRARATPPTGASSAPPRSRR